MIERHRSSASRGGILPTERIDQDLHSSREAADALGDLVAAIGGASFPARFLDMLRALAGVEMCSVFCRNSDQDVKLLFAAGEPSQCPGFSLRASSDYAGGFWRSDAQLAPLWRARSRRPLIVRQRAADIADPLYRAACYDRARVTDRVSILWPGQPCFVASGYHTGADAAPTNECMERLEYHAGVLIAALRQHLRAKAASGHPADEESLIAGLLALGAGLSRREAEIAAALILGETQEAIALAKHLSPATVVTYRRRAYGKLGVANRVALLALHRQRMADRGASGTEVVAPRLTTGHR